MPHLEGMRPQRWKDHSGIVHGWRINNDYPTLPRETYCDVTLATKAELAAIGEDEPFFDSIVAEDLYFDEPITCLECLAEAPR